MKIIMFSESFGGNTTTFINNEIEYLSKHHELLYICTKKINSGIFSYKNVKQVNFLYKNIFEKILWYLWKYDIYMSFKNKEFKIKLNKIINDFKPDIIHCHFGIEAFKLIDNIEDTSIPIVIHFHGYDASTMLRKKTYVYRLKKTLKQYNIYSIFVSNYLYNNLKKLGIDINSKIILYCGVNIDKFSLNTNTTSSKDDKIIFLQVSSLVKKKGHEFTLQAFAKFLKSIEDKNNYKLILTGDGERKSFLKKLSIKLGISKYVNFVGFVSPDEAMQLMEKADVFVHHSITADNGDKEGIPTAIMEAMAMKLPIISTKHSGIPELIKNGDNGILVEERDIESYAKAMKEILSWGKISKNRELIVKKFEFNKHNKILEDLYINIINGNQNEFKTKSY